MSYRYQVKIDDSVLPESYTLDELLSNGLLDDYDENIFVKQANETEWKIARDYPYADDACNQTISINDDGSITRNTNMERSSNSVYSVNEDGTVNRPNNCRRQRKPDSNMIWAIISISICLPFGIVALMESVKVDSLYSDGNVNGAIRASENAKKWAMWSIYAWIGLIAIIFIATIVGS